MIKGDSFSFLPWPGGGGKKNPKGQITKAKQNSISNTQGSNQVVVRFEIGM
jgi:hypothetical protein